MQNIYIYIRLLELFAPIFYFHSGHVLFMENCKTKAKKISRIRLKKKLQALWVSKQVKKQVFL